MRKPAPAASSAFAIAALFGVPALGQEPSVRGLIEASQIVVRGQVLDEEPAPGGLWHRFAVEEVIWPVQGEGDFDPADIGPVLRLFAHGPGVPEGAELPVGARLVVGASWVPELGPRSPAFVSRLWAGFRPDRAGERPAIVSSDGILPADDPAGSPEAARALVQGLRSSGATPESRREILVGAAAHREPSIRAEALRQLARPHVALEEPDRERLLGQFAAEVEGDADPHVLTSHLELAQSRSWSGLGPILVPLLRGRHRADVAQRAAEVLAEQGTASDFQDLARQIPETPPDDVIRVVTALSGRPRREQIPALSAALKAEHPAVRAAAATGLGAFPRADAERLLRAARSDSEPIVRAAATRALEPSPGGARAAGTIQAARPAGEARSGWPGLKAVLEAARRKAAEPQKGRP